MLQKLRSYALPIAMMAGFVAHDLASSIAFLTPYLLFAMLLVSYCKLDIKSMRITPMYVWMLAVQFVGAWAIYWVVSIFDPVVAQGAFICLFCPTATSAPVVAAMLGGNLSLLVGYSLLCNMLVALTAPLF
ncbi:MAG: transporter, partial [Bacteroidales bacterium]|nr:transporter [Bacteroidales bacterium]